MNTIKRTVLAGPICVAMGPSATTMPATNPQSAVSAITSQGVPPATRPATTESAPARPTSTIARAHSRYAPCQSAKAACSAPMETVSPTRCQPAAAPIASGDVTTMAFHSTRISRTCDGSKSPAVLRSVRSVGETRVIMCGAVSLSRRSTTVLTYKVSPP